MSELSELSELNELNELIGLHELSELGELSPDWVREVSVPFPFPQPPYQPLAGPIGIYRVAPFKHVLVVLGIVLGPLGGVRPIMFGPFSILGMEGW